MDGVTSGFHLGKSLDPLDQFRVENNICACSTRLADLLHKKLQYTWHVYWSLRPVPRQCKGGYARILHRMGLRPRPDKHAPPTTSVLVVVNPPCSCHS